MNQEKDAITAELISAKTLFLASFEKAWKSSAAAYDKLEINSERCLQARIYHELKIRFKKNEKFNIFIEARIDPHKKVNRPLTEEDKKRRNYIDTVITYDASDNHKYIIAGIEIKFNSQGYPKLGNVRKDFEALSHVIDEKSKVIIKRIEADPIKLVTSQHTIVLFCAYYKNSEKFSVDKFLFGKHRPRAEYTSDKWVKEDTNWRARTLPHRLYLFGSITPQKGQKTNAKTEATKSCNPKYDNRWHNSN